MILALLWGIAPAQKRGRIIGVFSMASLGSRMCSGCSVGILGQSIGILGALAVSTAPMLVLTPVLFNRFRGGERPA